MPKTDDTLSATNVRHGLPVMSISMNRVERMGFGGLRISLLAVTEHKQCPCLEDFIASSDTSET